MGRRLAYPDVPHSRIYEIYKQSLRQPIHAFGFFIDPAQLYYKKIGNIDSPDVDGAHDVNVLLWNVRMELMAAGLHQLSVASIPMPKQRRTIHSPDNAWLVLLGTGFDKTPHVDIPDDLELRVRAILETEEQPAWWSMRGFNYPPPELWIRDTSRLAQEPLD